MRKVPFFSFFLRPHVAGTVTKRHLVQTRFWEFSDDEEQDEKILHYTVSKTALDDEKSIRQTLQSIIKSNPDSLLFLTQKSKLTKRSDENPNYYVPLTENELNNPSLMIDWIKKRWLRPDGGHTCMAVTDENGETMLNSDVSLRPSGKHVITGKSTLHPLLYPKNTAHLHTANHTTMADEINTLAKKMMVDKIGSISADITVIPLAKSKAELDTIMRNINSARALKLYNLCSLIVKDADIEKINDTEVKYYVKKLQSLANSIPGLQDILTDDNESVLAALACTHAVVKACTGDTHKADREIFPDQDTQTAVVYCTIALTGSSKFAKFAKEINFLDSASLHTKPSSKLT